MASRAARRQSAAKATSAGLTPRIGARVGFARIPSNPSNIVSEWEGTFTAQARDEMAAIIKRFNDLVGTIKNATPDALAYALEPTFELSQFYVPYRTGALQESGRLEPDYNSSRPRAFISYGNGLVNYAAIVHEQVHFYHAPPTQAKYLQRALEETLRGMKGRVIAALRGVVGE